MNKVVDIKGCIYGRLKVLYENPYRVIKQGRGSLWVCECTCGKIKTISASNLKSGSTQSCGCLTKELASDRLVTHGLSKHPLYSILLGMKKRCYDAKDKFYYIYGGRGITICDRGLESLENFIEDMEVGYEKGLHIDRKDNNKGYSRDNCRWVLPKYNNMNTGSHRGSTSGYKGVSWKKQNNNWVAQIRLEGNKQHIGSFKCEKEAALAYNTKARELFGKYAYLNNVEDV